MTALAFMSGKGGYTPGEPLGYAELAPMEVVGEPPPRVPDDQIDFRKIYIEADLGQQRVFVWETWDGEPNPRLVRSMITSSGLDTTRENTTPRGTFSIENRGTWFFNAKYNSGAKYWVSFKNWGEYLFHSVAMDARQQVIPEEAEKLGTKASHGCLRLTVEDSKWIFDHVRAGTKVVVHD